MPKESYLERQQRLEAAFAAKIDGNPTAFYDIGVGLKTEAQVFRKRFPNAKCYGCEPDPNTYRALAKSRKFPGTLWEVAISSKRGSLTLYSKKPDKTPLHRMAATIFPSRGSDVVQHTVKCITLDEFDRRAGVHKSIVLWMDIEGAELDALKSGTRLLRSGRVKWINLEEHTNRASKPAGWPSPEEVDRLLQGFGYVRVCAYNKHPTHQDVIYRLQKA